MAAIVGLDPFEVEAACREAAQGEAVEAVNFNAPEQTVIAGHAAAVARASAACTARGAKRAGSGLRDALIRQIDSAVRFTDSVRVLAREGVDRGLEIGPGNVLAGLVRRIEKSIKVEAYGG